jgi:hypothetical protein
MRIAGTWRTCDDGIARPVLRGVLSGAQGRPLTEWFLIDTGADQTVLSGAVRFRLGIPGRPPDTGYRLMGIGGASDFVLITTQVEFSGDDDQVVRVRGEFSALTDPAATDFSVLGRDVLDKFDLALSRHKDEIWLLTGTHRYRIETKR